MLTLNKAFLITAFVLGLAATLVAAGIISVAAPWLFPAALTALIASMLV